MNKNIYLALSVLVVISVIGASISLWNGADDPEDEDEGVLTTLTDIVGRNVTISLPVKSVVLADTEALNSFAAVAGDDLMDYLIGGLPKLQTNYPDLYERYHEAFPEIENIASVGDMNDGTFSAEAVIALQPDVLILPVWSILYGTAPNLDALAEAGIQSIFIDFLFEPFSSDTVSKSISLIGQLIGEEERAEEINDFWQEQVDMVYDVVDEKDGDIPTVYFEVPYLGASQIGFTSGDIGAAMIDEARGDNIAKGLVQAHESLSAEYIISSDPDVIVFCISTYYITAESELYGFGKSPSEQDLAESLSSFLERDGWSDLTAVEEKRVHFFSYHITFNVLDFAILQYLAAWLYPTDFSELDPMDGLQEFFDRFMPIDLDGTWTYSMTDMDDI